MYSTLKGFVFKTNPFRVVRLFMFGSQGSRSSNPGLKLANASGVIFVFLCLFVAKHSFLSLLRKVLDAPLIRGIKCVNDEARAAHP